MDDPITISLTESNLSDGNLESIIDRLKTPEDGFPTDAIEAARKRSKEITPHLIRLIEDTNRGYREMQLDKSYGQFFAAFLLAEFRAVEAWPAIRDVITLPDDLPYQMFGDAITENLGCIIAALTGDDLEVLDDLIMDQSVDEFVRWAMLETALYRVRDGILSREDAIAWLAGHLVKAIENNDVVAEGLVLRLEDLAAEFTLPLIERAFAAGLIDEDLNSLESVMESFTDGNQTVEETMARLHRPDELIDHMQRWTSFDESDPDQDFEFDDLYDRAFERAFESYDSIGEVENDYIPDSSTTIRNEGIKIGRNDKCPCGSGKKYKKCCGRTSGLSL